ncbi:glycosyltransferase [Desulfobacterota bacterium M19]
MHILIFEPRLGGHHLSWLGYIIEDFLSCGINLTIAVDLRGRAREVIMGHLDAVLAEINIISAYNENGNYRGGSKIASMQACFTENGADEIFMNNFDEIASATLRKAALGLMPPESLRGKINGIYFRPRFMESPHWPPGNIIKNVGFKRLCRGQWLKNIFLLDEYLISRAQHEWQGPKFHFLPDVWQGNFTRDKQSARRQLGIPADKFVFLNYGIGTRRKGLHLTIRALLQNRLPDNVFLLCAGKIAEDKELRQGVAALEKKGLAKILNRYVSNAEEELCFAACDTVLLPYVRHFGSSGVLSRAAAAGKLVIASDEGLVARRVRDHHLGLLFQSGNVELLRKVMGQCLTMTNEHRDRYRQNACNFARSCSRKNFRQALQTSFETYDTEGHKICS